MPPAGRALSSTLWISAMIVSLRNYVGYLLQQFQKLKFFVHNRNILNVIIDTIQNYL